MDETTVKIVFEDWSSTLLPIAGQFAATVIGVSLAAWLAMRKFKTEKVWEIKSSLYSELIRLLDEHTSHIESYFHPVSIDDVSSCKKAEISKLCRLNQLYLSEAIKEVNKFLTCTDGIDLSPGSQNQLIFIEHDAAYDCLSKVIRIAASDLGIKQITLKHKAKSSVN